MGPALSLPLPRLSVGDIEVILGSIVTLLDRVSDETTFQARNITYYEAVSYRANLLEC